MRIGYCLLSALTLLISTGCGTIVHTPKNFGLEEPWPATNARGPVDVRSGDAAAGRFEITLPGRSMTVDLQEYTEALVSRVRAALTEQGVAIQAEAPIAVEIEVVYANILPQMRFHCVVDFTVRAGNGYVRGHQARAKSGQPKKACDAALSQAALEMLGDESLQRYLAGGS